MGSVRMGVPTRLVLAIRQYFGANCFIETGTFQAATAAWAAGVFPAVVTIEASEQLHARAVANFGHLKNVRFLRGSSPAVLREITATLPQPAIFWLDAHWSGGATAGQEYECPALDEIRAINIRGENAFILIDDARLFMSPPPLPHKAEQWPDIATVLAALREKNPSRYIVISEDVIIAVPAMAREFLIQYCRRIG
ncbi:MAG TPA: hypothetical protein VGG44_08005 [Tepidisphaeraceae bacterium]|jgi:hypothetical protein